MDQNIYHLASGLVGTIASGTIMSGFIQTMSGYVDMPYAVQKFREEIHLRPVDKPDDKPDDNPFYKNTRSW